MLEVAITAPPPSASRAGRAAWVPNTTPSKLMAMARR